MWSWGLCRLACLLPAFIHLAIHSKHLGFYNAHLVNLLTPMFSLLESLSTQQADLSSSVQPGHILLRTHRALSLSSEWSPSPYRVWMPWSLLLFWIPFQYSTLPMFIKMHWPPTRNARAWLGTYTLSRSLRSQFLPSLHWELCLKFIQSES